MEKPAECHMEDFGHTTLVLHGAEKFFTMTAFETGLEAFKKIAVKNNATSKYKGNISEYSFFEAECDKNQRIFIFDSVHGVEEMDRTSVVSDHLGDILIQGSVHGNKSRFSQLAVYNEDKKTISVYKATMGRVNQWRSEKDFEDYSSQIDYMSHVTSLLGRSCSG